MTTAVDEWKSVWEPKIIRMGENEKESSKALKNKLQGTVLNINKQVIILKHFMFHFLEHPQRCTTGQSLTILEHMFYPRNARGKKSLLYYITEVM